MIVAIIDVTIDMYLQWMSTRVIKNESNIMIFSRVHFNKGYPRRWICLKIYMLAYNWIPVSAKCCRNLSNIRRANTSSGAGFAWTALSPVQRTPALHGITREKAPFFPRERMPRTRVRVSPRPRPSLPPLLLFPREEEPTRGCKSIAARQWSERARGNRTVGRA